ncbi:MAG TPA: TOMM precursor leader peptide-binding protein [Solirubrobacterales bacterium]|jgi:bacteriocin biosynthesis cyclodehydratase domain-containing protein|nr:TOMM precursor leader peptide-binding protein [Solirubrobacterales bacterium]
MRKPRIKRTTESIVSPEGDLYLLRPSAGNDIRIEKPSEEDRRLLDSLDGEHTLAQLREEFGEKAVGDLISQLQELEVVEDAADDELLEPRELARFDRQLRYFSDIGDPSRLPPSECQRRLREAKVAVLGVGGLGGWAAWALACCGIGEMWLIDGDRVEISNLNRQILYTEADLGLLKVECAAARLRAFNPAMRVTATARRLESQAEIADFIAGSDFVVDAADWPAHDIERWCNSACFEAAIPYITMSHFPPIARVGPLYIPGKTGCYSCQETAYRREYPLFDVAIEQRRAQPSPAATLGPACGLIGGQVGLDGMHLLTGLAEPSTLGVSHIYDLRTMEVKRESVVPDPDCPVCGHLQPAEWVEDSAHGS